MMLGRRCVAVEVSCAAQCQDTQGRNISSHLFSCHCNSLLFFREGWAEGGTKKTWLLSLPFFPNAHSEGLHSALRYLFPAKKENKNLFVTLLIYTAKPKSIKEVKYLSLPQAPGFSDLSDCYLSLPSHSQPVRVCPKIQHPCGAFSWEEKQEKPKSSQQCMQEKWSLQSQAEIPKKISGHILCTNIQSVLLTQNWLVLQKTPNRFTSWLSSSFNKTWSCFGNSGVSSSEFDRYLKPGIVWTGKCP